MLTLSERCLAELFCPRVSFARLPFGPVSNQERFDIAWQRLVDALGVETHNAERNFTIPGMGLPAKYQWMEAIASRSEAIAHRLEAIACRLEAIACGKRLRHGPPCEIPMWRALCGRVSDLPRDDWHSAGATEPRCAPFGVPCRSHACGAPMSHAVG